MSLPIIQERPRPLEPHPECRNSLKKILIKSSSFNRLKNVPSSVHSYFCRHGSAEILEWINNSRSKLSESVKELTKLHFVLLIPSICAAFGLFFFHLATCLFALVQIGIPYGLLFLFSCIIIMTAIVIRINLRQMSLKLKNLSQYQHPKCE